MRFIFLGTNGWYDTKTGNTICVFIETAEEYLVLDAGHGFYKIDQYSTARKPIYLFLSHFHLDHISGVHILNKFHYPQGIDIFGPPGLYRALKYLIAQPFTAPIKDLKTPLRIHELGPKTSIPLSVLYKKLKHSTLC